MESSVYKVTICDLKAWPPWLPAFEACGVCQANTVLARQLKDLEKKYNSQFKVVFDAIRQLMTPPAKKQRKIGFKVEASGK